MPRRANGGGAWSRMGFCAPLVNPLFTFAWWAARPFSTSATVLIIAQQASRSWRRVAVTGEEKREGEERAHGGSGPGALGFIARGSHQRRGQLARAGVGHAEIERLGDASRCVRPSPTRHLSLFLAPHPNLRPAASIPSTPAATLSSFVVQSAWSRQPDRAGWQTSDLVACAYRAPAGAPPESPAKPGRPHYQTLSLFRFAFACLCALRAQCGMCTRTKATAQKNYRPPARTLHRASLPQTRRGVLMHGNANALSNHFANARLGIFSSTLGSCITNSAQARAPFASTALTPRHAHLAQPPGQPSPPSSGRIRMTQKQPRRAAPPCAPRPTAHARVRADAYPRRARRTCPWRAPWPKLPECMWAWRYEEERKCANCARFSTGSAVICADRLGSDLRRS